MTNDGRAWKDAFERLRLIGTDDEAFVDAGLNADRNQARATAASLYVRYIVTSNELTTYHDVIIQPQIRILIIKMIMCIYGRILELKQILIDEDFSIYTPIIEELINARMTHDQFELKIPRCFRDERQTFLEHMNNRIDEINTRIEVENNNSSKIQDELSEVEENWSGTSQSISQKSSKSVFDMATYLYNEQNIIPQILLGVTEEDILRELAIKLIQRHIRAMKDRIIINELLADKRSRENILSGKYVEPSKEKVREAVVMIQRYWRFYRIIRRNRVRKQRLNTLIGMHNNSSEASNFNDNLEVENKIRLQQASADIKLRKVFSKLQDKANKEDNIEIIESIEDELRAYIETYYKTCKHLPSWPDSKPIMFYDDNILGLPPINLTETILKSLNIPNVRYSSAMKQRVPLGGSALFHTGMWMTIEMAEILAILIVEYERKPAKERNQLIKQLANEKKILKEERIQIAKDIINDREKSRALGFVPEPSDLSETFKQILDEFDNDWTIDGLDERAREDLIKNEIYSKAQVELRAMVDNTTIKEELNTLKIAYAQDLGQKYKAPKIKLKKPAKPRSKKNQFPNPEEIFEELVKNNMIKKSVTSKFNDFKGDVLYSGSALRGDPFYLDPPYGLGDIRQIIKELCVIGLTFVELRTLLKQFKFSPSLLIAGPNKSGKTMLTNAICTETGSLKIELTLKNVSENYPNVKQINQLVKNIVKFATIHQPVLIEVDLADVPFYKKIPKELKLYKPKLMEKTLLKLLKSLKKTERVIIIGKATCPWLTSKAKLTKVFKNVVFTVPDYNTIFILLNDLLMSYPAVDREFPVTPLATMLAGYPRHEVAAIVAEVMTQERVLQLRIKPLSPFEFVPAMMKYPKKGPALCDRYYNWYNKYVPLGVLKRLKMTEQSEARKKKKKPSKK